MPVGRIIDSRDALLPAAAAAEIVVVLAAKPPLPPSIVEEAAAAAAALELAVAVVIDRADGLEWAVILVLSG